MMAHLLVLGGLARSAARASGQLKVSLAWVRVHEKKYRLVFLHGPHLCCHPDRHSCPVLQDCTSIPQSTGKQGALQHLIGMHFQRKRSVGLPDLQRYEEGLKTALLGAGPSRRSTWLFLATSLRCTNPAHYTYALLLCLHGPGNAACGMQLPSHLKTSVVIKCSLVHEWGMKGEQRTGMNGTNGGWVIGDQMNEGMGVEWIGMSGEQVYTL